MQRRRPRWLSIALGLALVPSVVPAYAQDEIECSREPTRIDRVTNPRSAIPGYPDRRVTTAETIDYFRQVAEESPRVQTATYARSWKGTPLVYSLVATPTNLRRVEEIARSQQRLRDPRRLRASEAGDLADSTPAIVWYSANVHGNETSGSDAAVEILYELASRTDCEVLQMLDNLVIGIMPNQNPDGRDIASRTNAYSFDMNRDWFARTQPETDGKLKILARYPPVMFIDAHEMGSSNFFFPPNSDPIYHEISNQSLSWINNIYGKAMAKAFDERQSSDPANWDYFNYSIYDLFYMGYGDTVPTTAFTAAGMTFEKGTADPDRQRWVEQFVAGWTSLKAAADNKDRILREYYEAHVAALREGRAGKLEPNLVLQPENKVQRQVPNLTVRHYFINPSRARPEVLRLLRRLMSMGVEAYRLTERLRVPALHRYGRRPRAGVVPKGHFWIPLAQPQKRWVQALLHEDSYVPFPYFYDVTAWSNPLLMNLDAAFTGSEVQPVGRRLRHLPRPRLRGPAASARFFWWRGDSPGAVAAAIGLEREGVPVSRLQRTEQAGARRLPEGAFVVPARAGFDALVLRWARSQLLEINSSTARRPTGLPVNVPRVAVYYPSGPLDNAPAFLRYAAPIGESLGHLAYTLEQRWEMSFDLLNAAEVAAGRLTLGEYDVFIVPGIPAEELEPAEPQIRSWIEGGGTYVGTARPGATGGTPFAVRHGYTTAELTTSGAAIPGTLFRVRVKDRGPVSLGALRRAYWYNLGEDLLSLSESGRNVATYPSTATNIFFSAYAEGEGELKGTAALVHEKLGDGQVVLFSGEPNFRAFTEGSAFFLANALLLQRPPLQLVDVASPSVATAVRQAMKSAARQTATGPGRPIRIEVPAAQTRHTLELLREFDDSVSVAHRGDRAVFEFLNPQGLDVEGHPFAYRLLPSLRDAGIVVLLAIL
ncbi:MAG TPA: M14 family zinc carboxypeptidase [Actinomycetota bacterium]|nr:M14 family zinc carboxypeptidase [Actinomycetota bacterium]